LAQWLQQLHPLRLQYQLFSDANPIMASVAALAEQARNDRKPMAADNPFVAMQEHASRQIVAALDAWRDTNETLAEKLFLAVYGSPAIQAVAGIDLAAQHPLRKAPKNPLHQELLRNRIAELKARIPVGGLPEAMIRGLIYAGMPRAAVDERGFEAVRRVRRAHGDMSLSAFKTLVREQFAMLLLDSEAALAAIPAMLPADVATRSQAFGLIKEVLSTRGDLSATDNERLARIAKLFEVEDNTPFRRLMPVPSDQAAPLDKAS
jgi:hypothetical protein